jgi:hypothetical protein
MIYIYCYSFIYIQEVSDKGVAFPILSYTGGNSVIKSCMQGNCFFDMSRFSLACRGNIAIYSCIGGNIVLLQFVVFSVNAFLFSIILFNLN